jgi:hypothetical protein
MSGNHQSEIQERNSPMLTTRYWTPAVGSSLGAVLVLSSLFPGTAAADGGSAPPAMTIKMSDGSARAVPGSQNAYRITLTNLGRSELRKLRLVQSLPARSTRASAGQAGVVGKDGTITWTVDAAPGKAIEVTSRAVTGTVDRSANSIASTVCAHVAGRRAPVVCASDLTPVSAGAAGPQGAGADHDASDELLPGLLGASAAAATAGGAVWLLRRRRAGAASA